MRDGVVEVSRYFPPHPLTPSPTVGRRGIGTINDKKCR
ncbi:hypothetical protein MC7420_5326 [Coleofasciculus chthonoplastes PCC 7420]|uniref:Uncharacterized protein n=1 Tax=Coleofasciculus chthonoplastes PCC 7420 TaxID=118168 RepID=B4W560_9CYAN|nr:hypothetical protein MC7420_5326 [Coleofasciculus chthonoplastes PCC 7420]